METIFDHNITQEEFVLMYGELASWYNTIEKWNKYPTTQRENYEAIYELYWLRGDMEKCIEYASKIPDDVDKLFGLLNHDNEAWTLHLRELHKKMHNR